MLQAGAEGGDVVGGAVVGFRRREAAFADGDVVGAPEGVFGENSGHPVLSRPFETGVRRVQNGGGESRVCAVEPVPALGRASPFCPSGNRSVRQEQV
ncbi:hypothetical protein Are01nite_90030 [Actinoplanes regularis]|nr:hypothetical protein Are01nite_90030 [Actinoplanes regularis]